MLIEKLELSAPPPSLTNQTDSGEKENRRCVRQTESGKWEAAIQNPITKVSVWLGCYDSPNEAADAYIKKKLEFDSLSLPKLDPANSVQDVSAKKKLQFDLAVTNVSVEETETDQPFIDLGEVSNADVASRIKRLPGSGSIRLRQSGTWEARISYKKSRVYVGSYKTYEEAEKAIDRKRQDLGTVAHVDEAVATESKRRGSDLIKTAEKKLKLSNVVVEGDIQAHTGTFMKYNVESVESNVDATGVASKSQETVADRDDIQVVVEGDIQAHAGTFMKYNVESVESNVDETGVASKSQETVADKDESGEKTANVDDIQVPSSSFGKCVINAYGELVDEFSRLDDELWLG